MSKMARLLWNLQTFVLLSAAVACSTAAGDEPENIAGTGGEAVGGQGGIVGLDGQGSGGGTSSGSGGGGNGGAANGGAGGGQAGAGGAAKGGQGGIAVGGSGGTAAATGGRSGIAKPARILCVGDSITEQKESWIYPMQDKLKSKGCEYKFLGYDASPYNGTYVTKAGYESKRIAAGGFSTRGILNLIKEKGLPDAPDVFVQYLGVNNVYGGFIDGKYNPNVSADPAGSYTTDTKEFIAMVRAKNPNAIFVLMKLQNNGFPQIDKAIDALVKSESKPESLVVFALGATGVDTVDGTHPTAAGAVTLAGPVSTVVLDTLLKAGVCK